MSRKGAQLWNSLLEEEKRRKKKRKEKRLQVYPSFEHTHTKKLSLPWINEIRYSAISTHNSKQTYLLETMVF